DSVYRFAWRMTGSTSAADDVTQECFVALLRASQIYYPGRGSWRSLLMGMARNIVLKRWRMESRWDELEDDSVAIQPVDPARKETAEMVAQAVQSLPPLQREVL